MYRIPETFIQQVCNLKMVHSIGIFHRFILAYSIFRVAFPVSFKRGGYLETVGVNLPVLWILSDLKIFSSKAHHFFAILKSGSSFLLRTRKMGIAVHCIHRQKFPEKPGFCFVLFFVWESTFRTFGDVTQRLQKLKI